MVALGRGAPLRRAAGGRMVPTRRRTARSLRPRAATRARGGVGFCLGSELSRHGGRSLSARHDVEGEVYSRLYGPATALGRERSGMLGADDPSLEASHPGEVDARAGRRGRGWRAAVRARARAWLATGSLRSPSAPRRGSVVAPRPSLARAVALL